MPSESRNCEEKDPFEHRCETAGNIVNDLKVGVRITQCGHITDGVSFAFGDQGGWVLSFDDLKAIYELACKRRSLTPSETTRAVPADLWNEIAEFIEGQVDVRDGPDGEQLPNTAMHLSQQIKEAGL